jgi:hypothetical protein
VLLRSTTLDNISEVRLADLLRYNLRSVRSYLLKEDFQFFWGYRSPYWAGRFLDQWCLRTMRSKIGPMKRVARMLRGHRPLMLLAFFPGIVRDILVSGLESANARELLIPPQPVLIPGGCDQVMLRFSAVHVFPDVVNGTVTAQVGFGFQPTAPIPRRPRARIKPQRDPIRARLSLLTNLPVVHGIFRITDLQDLLPGELHINWQAPRAVVVPAGRMGEVDIYFNLSEDRSLFQPGARLVKTVRATVTDLDGCSADAAFDATVLFVGDEEDFPRPPRFG